LRAAAALRVLNSLAFTGTKVQILPLKALRAAAAFQVLHRLALLVNK
jgi:hypothetical protein